MYNEPIMKKKNVGGKMDVVKFEEVANRVIEIRGEKVILDSDVAKIYGVQTKEINQAVANNSYKFPEGYILAISKDEWDSLRSKILTLKTQGRGKHTKFTPKAFTEKGLYMLATILKGVKATQTTIVIIETFAKLRELTRNIKELSTTQDKDAQKSLMQKSGGLITKIFDDGLSTSGSETTIELNLAVLKLKHTIERKK